MDRRPLDPRLRWDVKLLGELLGQALEAHQGRRIFDIEERLRALAKARRKGGRGASAEVARLVRRLSARDADSIIRAFAHFFELVNVAEQHHRGRRARADARARTPRPGSLIACLRQARQAGITAERAREALRSLRITLTFTAHPSQAARRSVLEKLDRIAQLLEQRDRVEQTPAEAAQTLEAMRETISILWLTDPIRHDRPRVGDEVKTIEWYLEEVLDAAANTLRHEIAAAYASVYHEPLGFVPGALRLHSWAGGDMDGNPSVTPEVLEDAIRAYHARGLVQLIDEVRRLGGLMSQSARYTSVPAELQHSLAEDERRFRWIVEQHGFRTEGEPWRRKLKFLELRLAATLSEVERKRAAAFPPGPAVVPIPTVPDPSPAVLGARELEQELALLARTLREASGDSSGVARVEALLARVRARGMHLAELEMRAPAAEVYEAAEALKTGRSSQSRVVRALERIAHAQREGGERSCRTLILSMARGADDLFAALACARSAGLWDDTRDCARLDVVPLFETFEALQSSPEILRQAFGDGTYRRHVVARGGQEVMLGYSDSGKEVGLLAASAALRRAQLQLRRVAAESGVPLCFFHGRGETVARGGGPAQSALLALPAGSVAGHFKVTEQGEALDHKYSRPDIALRTLELYVGGALLHTLDVQDRPPPREEARFESIYEQLAEVGRLAYRSLVWEEPHFVKFFEAASPVREISELKIGSRPSKRSAGGLEALRAIPWVFAWNQNRAILPGWFGVGTALDQIAARLGDDRRLVRMYQRWPFFRAVIDNVEMVLAKTDLEIAARYAELAPQPARHAVWPRLVQEHQRTVRWVRRLTGDTRLLDSNPTLQRSIELRNPYVDPLSLLQVELLRRKRAGDESCDRALLLTVGGIAAGMRNTG